MTYTAVNQHVCCNWPRPEDAHAAARPSERENARKATRVYHEDGQLRASLIPPMRTTVVESGDIMHFVPSYDHEHGGHRNLEFWLLYVRLEAQFRRQNPRIRDA